MIRTILSFVALAMFWAVIVAGAGFIAPPHLRVGQ